MDIGNLSVFHNGNRSARHARVSQRLRGRFVDLLLQFSRQLCLRNRRPRRTNHSPRVRNENKTQNCASTHHRLLEPGTHTRCEHTTSRSCAMGPPDFLCLHELPNKPQVPVSDLLLVSLKPVKCSTPTLWRESIRSEFGSVKNFSYKVLICRVTGKVRCTKINFGDKLVYRDLGDQFQIAGRKLAHQSPIHVQFSFLNRPG